MRNVPERTTFLALPSYDMETGTRSDHALRTHRPSWVAGVARCKHIPASQSVWDQSILRINIEISSYFPALLSMFQDPSHRCVFASSVVPHFEPHVEVEIVYLWLPFLWTLLRSRNIPQPPSLFTFVTVFTHAVRLIVVTSFGPCDRICDGHGQTYSNCRGLS
jgi:hypothetical protein